MTILLWIIGVTLVIVGLVGTVLPALPGAMLIVAGLVVAAWADGFAKVGVVTLVIIGVIGAASYLVDFAAAALGAKRFGASPRAMVGAGLGTLLGLFMGLPGIIIGPFLGAWIGFLVGMAVKVGIAFLMIGIFLLALVV